MLCSKEEAVDILGKWRNESSTSFILAGFPSVSFKLVGAIEAVNSGELVVSTKAGHFSVLFDNARFGWEDPLAWDEAAWGDIKKFLPPTSSIASILHVEIFFDSNGKIPSGHIFFMELAFQ